MAVDVPPRSRPGQPESASPPRTATWRAMAVRGAALGAIFLAAAIVMAFPSITKFRSALPGDYGDAFLSRYLLQWDVHSLFSRSVFSPTMFWPTHDVLAYSDPELAIAPVAAALRLFFSWTVVYNTIYLACWVASQAFTYLLARWLKASRPAAVLAALVFSFSSVRLGHYGHFPLLFGCLAPLDVLLLLMFLEQRRWWQAAALGAGGAAIFLNAGYVAVVLFPVLFVVAGGWLIATRFNPGRRFYAGLALTGVVAFALILPAVKVDAELGSFLSRPYVQDQVVTPRNFLAPGVDSWLYGGLERTFTSDFENKLFPGFIAIALGVVGGFALITSRRRADGSATPDDPTLRRRGLLLLLLGVVPGFLLSFGKYQLVSGHRIPFPYAVVGLLPGYKSIRAFGRFTVIPVMGLAVLAAVGFDRLMANRKAVLRAGVAAVLAVGILCEMKIRIGTSPTINDPQLTAVNYALAALPAGPVLELPMGDTRTQNWAFVEAPRLVLATIDWKPRVNGYSGYSPVDYEVSIDLFNGLAKGGPAPAAALVRLDQLGVRYIVIRTATLDPVLSGPGVAFEDSAAAARIVASLPANRVASVSPEGAALLVQLRPPPP